MLRRSYLFEDHARGPEVLAAWSTQSRTKVPCRGTFTAKQLLVSWLKFLCEALGRSSLRTKLRASSMHLHGLSNKIGSSTRSASSMHRGVRGDSSESLKRYGLKRCVWHGNYWIFSIILMSNTSFAMIDFTQFDSLVTVADYFVDEKTCKQALTETRWGYDIVCPNCGKHHCARRSDGRFRCQVCGHNFSCITGTIFENTKLPLRKWFLAMYLISSHKKGISSLQLSRDIEVTQKTAWFMLHKIRSLFAQGEYVRAKDIHTNGIEGF